MIAYKNRASAIIYNFLMSMPDKDKIFLLPSNVCPIVPLIFYKAQIKFEFVDINKETLCMDLELVKEKIYKNNNDYSGILFVHTYGVNTIFEEKFKQLKDINKNIIIIEDKCLSIPEFSRNESSCVDMVLYSTGYSKVIELGYGGFAFINSKFKYKDFQHEFHIEMLDNISEQYKYSINNNQKFKYKECDWLDTLNPKEEFHIYQQLVTNMMVKNLNHKSKLNHIYSKNLPMDIQLADNYQWWRFNILVPESERLLESIFKEGLFASSHYVSLANTFSNDNAPNAEKLSKKVVNLFNDYHFDEDMANRVVNVINIHLSQYS